MAQHVVAAGSLSPPCSITCAAGTRVVTPGAACTTPSGGWFTTASHTVLHGLISPVQYCTAGFGNTTTAATTHTLASHCTMAVPAGHDVPTSTIQARYIRVTSTGSNINTGTHMIQIQAFAATTPTGTNFLAGRGGTAGADLTNATNGDWGRHSGVNIPPTFASGSPMTWDMGSVQTVGSIRFSMFTDGRVYENVRFEVSTDNSNWTTIFGPQAVRTQNLQENTAAHADIIRVSSVATLCASGRFMGAHNVNLGSTSTCTQCPTQTAGWTRGSDTPRDGFGRCWQTRNATNISANCQSGQMRQTATSATAWGNLTFPTAFVARAGNFLTNGGTINATCTACPAVPAAVPAGDPWVFENTTGWSAVTDCRVLRIAPGCAGGQLRRNATSATAWGVIQLHTALSAPAGWRVNNFACAECPTGTRSAGGTTTNCATCPTAGQTTSGPGTSTATNCIACPNTNTPNRQGWVAATWDSSGVRNLCLPICQAGFFVNWHNNPNTCSQCPVFNNDWGNWAQNSPNPHNATTTVTSTAGALSAEECRVLSTQPFTDDIGIWQFQNNVDFRCGPSHRFDPITRTCQWFNPNI
jgi:hypothetical protein